MVNFKKGVSMSGTWFERSERLKLITQHLELSGDYPLLSEVKIDEGLFNRLSISLKNYLASALWSAKFTKSYDISDNILIEKHSDLLCLPNRTPNGVIVPKKDIFLEYNIMQRCLSLIMKSLALDASISSIHLPVMTRLVDGRRDEVKDNRPYASTKPHSDIWSKNPPHLIMIFIPVLGDVEHTGIEFFEPDENEMIKWIKPLSDYSEGAHLLLFSQQYPLKLRKGFLYLTDAILIHNTVKKGGGIRVSIDFSIIPAKPLSRDADFGAEEQDFSANLAKSNYVSLPEWYAVGERVLLVPNETFKENMNKYKSNQGRKAPIDYQTEFQRVRIP